MYGFAEVVDAEGIVSRHKPRFGANKLHSFVAAGEPFIEPGRDRRIEAGVDVLVPSFVGERREGRGALGIEGNRDVALRESAGTDAGVDGESDGESSSGEPYPFGPASEHVHGQLGVDLAGRGQGGFVVSIGGLDERGKGGLELGVTNRADDIKVRGRDAPPGKALFQPGLRGGGGAGRPVSGTSTPAEHHGR